MSIETVSEKIKWIPFFFAVFMALLIGSMVAVTLTFEPRDQVFPLIIGVPTLILTIVIVLSYVSPSVSEFAENFNATFFDSADDFRGGEGDDQFEHGDIYRSLGWIFFLLVGVYLLGLLLFTPLFLYAYLRIEGGHERRESIIISLIGILALYLAFEQLLNRSLFPGVLFDIAFDILGV